MPRPRPAADRPARVGYPDSGAARRGHQKARCAALPRRQHEAARGNHAGGIETAQDGAEGAGSEALLDGPERIGRTARHNQQKPAGIEPEPHEARAARQPVFGGGPASQDQHDRRLRFSARGQQKCEGERAANIEGPLGPQLMQPMRMQTGPR